MVYNIKSIFYLIEEHKALNMITLRGTYLLIYNAHINALYQ